MKRALVLCLAVSLLFSAIPAGAASFSDVEAISYQTAVTHLSNIGIIKGYEDGSFRPDEVMTRGEFAVVMAKLFGSEEGQIILPNPYFYDVPEEHFAKNSILYCIYLGLMEGYGDGYFRPDQPISYTEAVKIMVCALGYYPLAVNKGGYPTGFLAQANELTILKGIKKNASEKILREEIAQLAYNSLNVQLLEETSFGSSTQLETRGNTILSKYLKMDIIQGVVLSNGYTKIAFVPDTGAEHIIIGDKKLFKNGRYETEFLGMYAEAIYNKEDDSLLSIVSLDNKNRELSLDGKDILGTEDSKVTYDSEGKEWKASVSDTRKVVYNGSFRFDYELSQLENLKDGYIRMVDNDNDNRYDVVFVNEFETFIVLDNAPSGKIIRDKKQGDKTLDLEAYDNVIFRDSMGRLLDYDSIGKINILNVLRSPEYLECIVSNETKSGEISQITSGEKGAYYHIGTQAFLLSDSFSESDENTLSVGDNVTAYLGVGGTIAYAEKSTSGMYRQAVLMGLRFEAGIEQTLQLKIFQRSGNVIVAEAAKNLYINGVKYISGTDVASITDALTYRNAQGIADRGVSQFILYKPDAEGKIREIYTAASDFSEDAKLYRTVPASSLRYAPSASNFDGVANVDSNTWLLKVPDGDLQDKTAEDFQIFVSSAFVNEQYQIEFYNTSKTKQTVDIVNVVGTNIPPKVAFDDALAVVSNVVQAVEESGEIGTKIKYYAAEKLQEAFVAETLSEAQIPAKGEIVRLSLNDQGKVNSVERYFDYANDKWIFTTSHGNQSASNYYGATSRIVAAYVTCIRDGYIRLGFEKAVAGEQEAVLQESHRLSNGYTIYIVTRNAGEIRVRKGESEDIELLDRVVVRTRAGAGREIYVMKESFTNR